MRQSRSLVIRIVALGVAIVALLVLAMALSRLVLDPGVPFAEIWQFLINQFRTGGLVGPVGGALPGSDTLVKLLRTFFVLDLIIFPFAVIFTLIDKKMRKRVLGAILRLALIFTLLALIIESQSEMMEEIGEFPLGIQQDGELAGAKPFTDEEFSPASVSRWLVRGLSLAVGLVAAAIAVVTIRRLRQSRGVSDDTWAQLAGSARAAITEIEGGGDLRSSILRCYVEMTRIVRESRGVYRGATMTAREFREYLIQAKLPPHPVNRLTELFEKARYGLGESSAQEESDAIASLQAIADACRSMG